MAGMAATPSNDAAPSPPSNDAAPSPPSNDAAPSPPSNNLVTIIIALIGLLGIIVGGVIAGTYLVTSNRQQADSSQSQSQREFVRDQQQKAYSELISKAEDLTNIDDKFAQLLGDASQSECPPAYEFKPGVRTLWDDSEALRPNVVTARAEFEHALASVKIVGSPAALGDAKSVEGAIPDLLGTYASDEALFDGCGDYWNRQLAAYDKSHDSYQIKMSNFEATARIDLGGSGN